MSALKPCPGDKVRINWPMGREHRFTGTVKYFNAEDGMYFVELDSGPPWRGQYRASDLEPVSTQSEELK